MVYTQEGVIKDSKPWAKMFVAGAAALTLSIAMFASAFAVTGSTTVVTESKREGWVFNPDASTASSYEFTEAAASEGSGSLYALPIQNDSNGGSHQGRLDKFIALLPTNYATQDFDTASFDFQLGSGVDVADTNQVYLNVYTKVLGSTSLGYDCRFDQVATVGSDSTFNTVNFDSTVAPTNVAKWSSSTMPGTCPTTLSGLPEGSTVTGVSLNLGDTSASLSDQGAAAYFDNVVLGVAGNTVAYNFEENLPVAGVKDDCKNNGWMNLGNGNDVAFKNQGSCVSYAVANGNASFKKTEQQSINGS